MKLTGVKIYRLRPFIEEDTYILATSLNEAAETANKVYNENKEPSLQLERVQQEAVYITEDALAALLQVE